MRFHSAWLVVPFLAALGACSLRQDASPIASTTPRPAPPMAPFARLTTGEWRTTAQSGTQMFDVWRWGPGMHSIRVLTDGQDASGGPWHDLRIFYWHPGRKQVLVLGLSPYARGVAEGAVRFDGEAAEITTNLHQTGGLRRLVQRWTFQGPDLYHDALLEAHAGGLAPLAEWDRVRVPARAAAPATPAPVAAPPDRLKPLAPLLSGPWQARDARPDRRGSSVRTTTEWIPGADAIVARVTVPGAAGDPVLVLDAYLYHHTGANILRCLALSDTGGVYEGDIAVLEGGALQADLTGHEADRIVRYEVRLDIEPGGGVWQRVWSVDGAARTLVLDLHHRADGTG